MDRGPGDLNDDATSSGEVVELPGTSVPPEAPPPLPPGRLHGVAIGGAALFGILFLVSVIAFITVGWPDDTGRWVKTVIVGSIMGFIVSCVTAIFAAARDTYRIHR